MLTCLALVAFNVSSLADIPKMMDDIEADARTLANEETISPELFARLQAFSAEAMRLSASLHQAGVGQDMPCVFQGIAHDASERAAELNDATTQAERDAALMNLRVLMDDTVMLAPMAAAAASDRAAQRNIALR